ncbi:Interferon-induced GTP-binding protein Mx2 [Anabarilius grahami]|uniref:Interferon-induced GTP-binding protein Mx2 n=1 Tax=Anabarilius grahami TaxID=495550 RepID=A0A3N0XGA3_ANAGA|nr:Interferon-induced GTP-binding protein Mx2 [Anabarilius grahami]
MRCERFPLRKPFDLHSEIDRAWKNPYLSRIHQHQHVNYADIKGLRELRYMSMPPSDEIFVSYLVAGEASTLKALVLPVHDRTYTAADFALELRSLPIITDLTKVRRPTNSTCDYKERRPAILIQTEKMHSLSSPMRDRRKPLIELIDSLRFIGIDKDIDLPSIAVVGDQSSGKSSVLEALSGVALPRGSGIVTRCPLELKLRKLKKGPWSGAISYRGHKETFYDPLKVDNLVRKAQNELAGNTVGISDEFITLEISSPDVCDLTLIDLPGITRVPVHDQPDDIGDQGKVVPLSKGYIIVRCRGQSDINNKIPLGEAMEMEMEFFRNHHYFSSLLNDDKASTQCLAKKLTKELVDHIKKSLPHLTEQIDTRLLSVREELKKYNLGPPLEEEKMGPFLSEKMIDDIQSKQEAKVEKRIKEFIDMEQLVFTQDKVLQKKLDDSDISQTTGIERYENLRDDDMILNSKGCALLDARNLVPDKLALYYEIVYQRLTDYVPMLIILFMLKDAAKTLRHQMLELRNGADVVKLLSEDSERGRRRAELKQRLERLTQAKEMINNRL